MKGTFYRGDGDDLSYDMRRSAGTDGYCDLRNLLTGMTRRVRPAVYLSQHVQLRVTKSIAGHAVKVSGKRTVIARLSSQCGGGTRYYSSYFRGVAVGH